MFGLEKVHAFVDYSWNIKISITPSPCDLPVLSLIHSYVLALMQMFLRKGNMVLLCNTHHFLVTGRGTPQLAGSFQRHVMRYITATVLGQNEVFTANRRTEPTRSGEVHENVVSTHVLHIL